MTSSSINSKETRKFGTIAFIFFSCLFTISIWRHKEIMSYIFGILGIFGLALFLLPKQLYFLHTTWVTIGYFIGKIITVILMSIAYYLVITPTAFIKRLFGGKPLPLKPDKNCSTYWVTRSEPSQPKERFIKRF